MKTAFRQFIAQRKDKVFLCIAAALALVFIFGQSALPAKESSSESGWLTEHVLNPILRVFGLSVKEDFTRKLAHVAEYFVIGVLISLIWDAEPVKSIYSGFTAAFIDETIQIFADRGPMISDVWIDMAGVVLGYLLALLLILVRKKKRKAAGAGGGEQTAEQPECN